MAVVLVAGMGNVGSALLPHLAADSAVDQVLLLCRDASRSQAAILDTASAHPVGARKFSVAAKEDLSRSDVIVMTSGMQIEEAPTRAALLEGNVAIARELLEGITLRRSAVLITLATPVDDVTPVVQKFSGLPPGQVLGFGGDLDTSRLAFVLHRRGLSDAHAIAIGEHGKNAIPVYPGEEDYAAVKEEVGTFLSKITSLGGRPRNLATGELLGKLIHSLLTDSHRIHHVSSFHPLFECFLTWAFPIGRTGAGQPEEISLGDNSKRALDELLRRRRSTV